MFDPNFFLLVAFIFLNTSISKCSAYIVHFSLCQSVEHYCEQYGTGVSGFNSIKAIHSIVVAFRFQLHSTVFDQYLMKPIINRFMCHLIESFFEIECMVDVRFVQYHRQKLVTIVFAPKAFIFCFDCEKINGAQA